MEKKRSLKYLIVSVCLALLVASIGGVIVGAGDSYKDNASLAIKGASLELDDKIALSFAVETAVAEGAELYIYNSDPTGTSDIGTPTTKTTKTIGGVEYALYVTDGFEATAVAETVYARLVNEETQEVGPVIKTGVYELTTMLLERLPAEAERTEAQTLRYNLYTAIIDYVEKAYTVINKTEHYPYHFIKVEDGYIVDHNGNKATQGVYNENYEITLVADGVNYDAFDKVAYGDLVFEIAATGWTSTGTDVKTSSFKPFESATYSNPTFAQYAYNADANVLKVAQSNDNLGSEADGYGIYAWNELRNNTAYVLPSAAGTAVQNRIGGMYYDATKDMIYVHANNKGTTAKPKGTPGEAASITLANPQYQAGNTAKSTVLEFNVMVPSQDNNGNGIMNETQGDFFNGTGNTAIFEMMVGYDAGNYAINFSTEVMFHLFGYTYSTTESNRVDGWGLGTNAASGSADWSEYNAFSYQSTAKKGAYYNLDQEYTIKVVITPGTYDSATDTFTYAAGSSYGRADIYVDGALHHSRLVLTNADDIANYENDEFYGTGTNLCRDRFLGVNPDGGQFRNVARFTNAQRIGITAYTPARAKCGFFVGGVATYTGLPTAVDYENDSLVELIREATDGVTHYDQTKHGQAYNVEFTKSYPLTHADVQFENNNSIIHYTASKANKTTAWNNLNTLPTTFGSNCGASGNNGGLSFIYNAQGNYIETNTSAGKNGDHFAFAAANPLYNMTSETYNGEKVVFRFSFMVPNQDGDDDGIFNEKYGDFMTNHSSNLNLMSFGYWSNSNFGNVGGNFVNLQIVRDGRANQDATTKEYLDQGLINKEFRIRTEGSPAATSGKFVEADYQYGTFAQIGKTWFDCIIIASFDENGMITQADINLNGTWNTRVVDGTGKTSLKNVSSLVSVFTQRYFGLRLNDKDTLTTSLYFKDFACYTIK